MSEDLTLWSVTASSNATADSAINWQENQLPGTVNGSARSMMAALAKHLKDTNGSLSTGGSSNAYTLASPSTNYTALTNGLTICVKASFTSTGNATFNLNSLGAKKIKTAEYTAAAEVYPGEITIGGHYWLQYDTALDAANGAWLLLNPSKWAGRVEPFFAATAPDGWAFSYGQAVSRTTYAATYAALGTVYGVGDGATTFNLPDLRGRSLFGRDDMGTVAATRITTAVSAVDGLTLGAVGGAQSITLDTTMIPSHTHTGTTGAGGSHTHSISLTTGSESSHTHGVGTLATAADGSHTHTTNESAHSHGISPAAAEKGGGTAVSAAGAIHEADDGASTTAPATTDLTINSGGSHTHTMTGSTAAGSAHTHSVSGTTGAEASHTHTFTTAATGGGLAHSNMPPAFICNFIVRMC